MLVQCRSLFDFQNVDVASRGPCFGKQFARGSAVEDNLDTSASISLDMLNRFASDGFVFSTKLASFGESPDHEDETAGDDVFLRERSTPLNDSVVELTRWTMDGSVYRAKIPVEELNTATATASGFKPNGVRRQLDIIGGDDRAFVTNTHQYPHSAISAMIYGRDNPKHRKLPKGHHHHKATGCTATLISRNVALTAGSCVRTKSGVLLAPTQIAPGRTPQGDPFGVWNVDSVSVFTHWETSGVRSHDMAVLVLSPRTYQSCSYYYPGDAAGYLGFAPTASTYESMNTARISGYATDRAPYGQQYSSVCPTGPFYGAQVSVQTLL